MNTETRFDWYQATVEEAPMWIRGALQESFGGEWVPGKARQGYSLCQRLFSSDGEEVCECLSGGAQEYPNVRASGGMAHTFALELRRIAPNHKVSRVDVCEDVEGKGLFERVEGLLVDTARKNRVAVEVAGDWHIKLARTLYVGGRTSPVRVRWYEKGKQYNAQIGRDDFSGDWCRLEAQVRPGKSMAKRMVARMEPCEVWGCAGWLKSAVGECLGVNVQRVQIGTVWKAQQLEGKMASLIAQYGRTLEEFKGLHGSWANLGEYLGRLIEGI